MSRLGVKDNSVYQRYLVALAEDLTFLARWEQGSLPLIGAMVRIRQIRRAGAVSALVSGVLAAD